MKQDIFQAIAAPTRRAIMSLIALQAMTPNTIASNFNTARQAVLKYLRMLTAYGLVKQEQKEEIYYALSNLQHERDRQMVQSIQKDLGNPV